MYVKKVLRFTSRVACTCASLYKYSGVCGSDVRGIDAYVWKTRSSAFCERGRGHVEPARVQVLHNYSGVGNVDVIIIVLFKRGKPVSLYLLRRPAKTSALLQDDILFEDAISTVFDDAISTASPTFYYYYQQVLFIFSLLLFMHASLENFGKEMKNNT